MNFIKEIEKGLFLLRLLPIQRRIHPSPPLSSLRRQGPSQASETKTVFYHLYEMLFFLNVSLGPCLRRDDSGGGWFLLFLVSVRLKTFKRGHKNDQ
jgi:hypothetical protein